jgi:hypothetical protein
MADSLEIARNHWLGGRILMLNDDSMPFILKNIDGFDRQARLNECVECVYFYGYSGDCQDNEVWDKLGQAIGNLRSLELLRICNSDVDEVLPTPSWEILGRILSQVRQKIAVMIDGVLEWDVEQSRCFARAIHGHPTITRFVDREDSPYESLDALYSALATLPALESISLSKYQPQTTPDDESAVTHPESLTELLRAPSLRSVCFDEFDFTRAFCQATANALMEGTAIIDLEFLFCSFSDGECAAMITSGLSRNTSLLHFKVVSSRDQALFDVLATALPSNSTLRRLDLRWQESAYDYNLSPFLLALGKNKGLKNVSLDGFLSIDESLCSAMQNGLGMNTTLECLEINHVQTNDNSDMWCRALSFLRANKALKYLMVTLDQHVTQSRAVACRTDIVAMLQENTSLQSLSILGWSNEIQGEEYVALITALLHNTTLKSISFLRHRRFLRLTDDEDKQMAVLLQKNYTLERLPDIKQGGDVDTILRLNEEGRRYLVQDGSSISRGVKVLSAVSNEINCVFLHLLENPRLCYRSAVEKGSAGESNGSSTNPTDGGDSGKRERASVHEGKASHRRLA